MSYINLNKTAKNPMLYKNDNIGFLDKAYYENRNLTDYAANYGITDWASDAARAYYREMQKGELQESEDKMTSSTNDMDDANKLLELYQALYDSPEQQKQAILSEIAVVTDNMRKNGSWSNLEEPTAEQLTELINDRQKVYNDSYETYKHDLELLNESIRNYDISQYYTRKSNDSTSVWGNFFFKMPATMGTSNTSAGWQALSMTAGFAGFKAGAAVGTAIGGPFGTAIGAVLGGLVSIAASQFAGGMQSRENESHMEAFNAFSQKVIEESLKRGVNLDKVALNVRHQMAERGVDVSNLDQNELIQLALSDKDIISGSSEFDEIAKEAFKGTRRVYEQNNSLGAGEVLSDLSYFVPIGGYLTKGGKALVKGTAKALTNPIQGALSKRFATGLLIANLGSKLRNKVILDKLENFVTGSAYRSLIEGSEEGAQNLIVKKYMNDEYADEYANNSLVDAISDGQLAEDLVDNLWLRAKSLGSFFSTSGEYSNDQQLYEEMISGAILPFFSPQGAIGLAVNARQNYSQIANSKRVGDYMAVALSSQDEINRNTQLYKTIREGVPNGTYSDLLDRVGDIIKTKRLNGKSKYKLDNTVITKDGSTPTNEQIDEFIADLKKQYDTLVSNKNRHAKQLKSLGLKPEDEDLLLSLAYNAESELARANTIATRNTNETVLSLNKIASDENFRNKVKSILGDKEVSDADYVKLASLLFNNLVIEYYDSLTNQQLVETAIKTALADSKITKYPGLIDAANSLAQALNEQKNEKNRRSEALKALTEQFGVDESVFDALDLSTLDHEQTMQMQKHAALEGNISILTPLLNEKVDKLSSTDKTYIEQQIEKYRNAQHEQHELADATNEAARTNAEVKEIEDTKVDTETKVQSLDSDKIAEQKEAVDKGILQTMTEFNTLIASIPSDSFLFPIVEELNKGKAFVENNPLDYARYVKNLMKRLAKKYKGKTEDENATEAEKKNLENLSKIAENLDKQLTRLTDLVNEENAKNELHNPKFSSDTTVWFDDEGNRYSFDFPNSAYSESEGLMLRMNQIFDIADDVEAKEAIEKLNKQIEALKKKDEQANANAISTLEKLINAIEETQKEKKTKPFIIRADNEFLKTLKTRDNFGNERVFENKLKKLVSDVNAEIDSNKKERIRKKDIESVDEDVYEFKEDEDGKKHGPKHQEQTIEESDDRPLMVKGYPLDTTEGAKVAAMLLNPYYAAKYWRGFITAPYSSSDEAKRDFSEKYAVGTRFGKKLNRYEAIDTFNKIGKLIAYLVSHDKATDDIIKNLEKLANGEVKEVKIGLAKLTKDEYDNMVYALPTRIYFNQPRVGRKWSYVVCADFMSLNRTRIPSQAEIDSRAELIHNLLLSYKENKKEQKKQDGLEDSLQQEQQYINRVSFGGDEHPLILTSGSYNMQITTLINTSSNIYQNADGSQMSPKEIREYYDNVIGKAVARVTERIDDFVEVLSSLGYNITKEQLLEPVSDDNPNISKLQHLLTGIAKYGDGVIDIFKTLYPAYVSKSIGQAKKEKGDIKKQNIRKAKKMLQFLESVSPDTFLSFKNYQDENKLTPLVSETVVDALSNRWFNGKDSIYIYVHDEALDTENTQENAEIISKIGDTFEKLLRESSNAEEFLQKLKDLGYSFKKNNETEKADEILIEYFNNRRFSKLSKPTNIMQAITMGTAEPLNTVNYENFNRILKHEQSKLTEINALGLIKDKDGKYVFSLDKYINNTVNTEEGNEAKQSELQVRKEELEKEKKEKYEAFAKIRKKEDLVNFIIENKNSFTTEEFENLLRTTKKGEFVLKYKIPLTKSIIKHIYDEKYDAKIEQLEKQIEDEIKTEIKNETEFADKQTEDIVLGFGSYSTAESGASIVYYDEKGLKHVMDNAVGTPGAIYLIAPSFLHATRRKTAVHLNPKKFDNTMAAFIATVLKAVSDGKVNLSSSISENDFEGFTVNTDMSVKQLLDMFIYHGTEAITNNPSDNNYLRLLHIDSNGVHFGTNTLTDENFDDLVEFIKSNKTYRVDRSKLVGNAILGNDLRIRQGDNVLFDHKANEVYTTVLIDEGLLTTDLNRTSNTIMAKPSVYVNYNKKVTFVSSAQRALNANTAASAKQKLGKTLNRGELQEEMEGKTISGGLEGVKKYAENFVKGFKKAAAKHLMDNGYKQGKFKVGIRGMKTGTISKTYDASLSPDVSTDGTGTGETMFVVSDNVELTTTIMNSIKSKKMHNLVLLDQDGKVLEINGNAFYYGNGFKNFKTDDSDIKQEKVETQLSSELKALIDATNKLYTIVTSGILQPGILIPLNAQTQLLTASAPASNSPQGYVGFASQPANAAQSADSATTIVDTKTGQHKKVSLEQDTGSNISFRIENGEYVYTENGYEIRATIENFDAEEFNNNYIGEDGLEEEVILRAIERFKEEDAKTKQATLTQTTNNSATQPLLQSEPKPQAGLTGLNLRPNPLSLFVSTPPVQPATETRTVILTGEKKVSFPTYSELMNFLKSSKVPKIKEYVERIKNQDFSKVKEAKLLLGGAIAEYMVANKAYENTLDANWDKALHDAARTMVLEINNNSAKTGAILEFLDERVQKEDFEQALSRVESILGKDFDFSFLPGVKRVWDNVRAAQIYVFGECAASGIRLYRDANSNKIAKGSFYHEAFHRISLFVLSKEDRQKMYDDAVAENPELANKSQQEIEEYLADKFADFVIESLKKHPNKYYTGNIFQKAFQLLTDAILLIVRKLSGKNITANYKGLNKLFKDMYSGRYAYAKATVNNIEEFEKIYGKAPAYSGFKSNGVILAEDAVQYTEIFRDMIGKLIYNSGIYTNTSGKIVIDTNSLKASYEYDVKTYMLALKTIDQQIRNGNLSADLNRFDDDLVAVSLAKMINLINVYKGIIEPDAWSEWVKIINRFVEHQFNLTKAKSNNPNDVLKADIKDDTKLDEDGMDTLEAEFDVLGFSDYRDSYMRDMYNSMDANVKMLLWSITDLDPKDVSTAKYTADGLLKFANVKLLYTNIVHVISGSTTIEEMLNKMRAAATVQIEKENNAALMLVYEILNSADVNPALRNKFFTEFVKYVHNFETHSYTTTAKNVGTDGEYRYSATTKNGNVEAVLGKLSSKWKSSMTLALDSIADRVNNLKISSEKGKLLTELRKPLKDAMSKLNINKVDTIKEILYLADKLYSFGLITGDLGKDAVIWQRAMFNSTKNGKQATRMLLGPLEMLNNSNSSEFKTSENGKKRSLGVYTKLDKMFEAKGILTVLSQQFGHHINTLPSAQSLKGPGNTKIFSIGLYNFITRTFTMLNKSKVWLDKMVKNAYNFHSTWLDTIKTNAEAIKVHTKLSTVLDDEYDDSVADKEVTEFEDLLNRYVSIWSGRHVTPALANKRFAADIEGIPMMKDLIDSDGNISTKAINTFIGYIADEILSISDAMYTRQYFIDLLNAIVKPKVPYIIDSFSKLSSLEQEAIFKSSKEASKLLRLLVKVYHFKAGDSQLLYDEKNDRIVIRSFLIDLRTPSKNGVHSGYKFRHYGRIMSNFEFTDSLVEQLSSNVFSEDSRLRQKELAYRLANTVATREAVSSMLRQNIDAAIAKFLELGGLYNNDNGYIVNRYLPEQSMKKYLYGDKSESISTLTSDDLYRAIGGATIQGMSDIAEFEKLCHGDVAYHKNIDGVTKRYSGIVSTTSVTSNIGTILNEFEEDKLHDASTYNTVALNTTLVVSRDKYKGEAKRTLGISPEHVKLSINDKNKLLVSIDSSVMLDDNGNIKEEYKNAPLIKRFITFREEGKLKLMRNGVPMTDRELVDAAIDEFKTRFSNYLKVDPTDAQSWMTSEMFRQLMQRKGAWDDTSEACYNLLTYFDMFGSDQFANSATLTLATLKMCKTLGISYEDLVKRAEKYRKDKAKNNVADMNKYKGWIFGLVDKFKFESPSLKYIYYGYDEGRKDGLTTPIYDKSSYKILWRIEVEGHEIEELYSYMKENDVHVAKQETATKSGGLPSFEIFDKDGKIDRAALDASVIQSQYFELLGDQLNTASHHTNDASLLTQFMKVTMMNTTKDHKYRVNGKSVNGEELRNFYKRVLDELTRRGFEKFNKEWGIEGGVVDKEKFMNTLQRMAQTENLPAETIAAFSLDDNGEFKIHPAAMPNIAWVMSRLLASMGDTIIDTTTPGKALYQVSSLGYDNLLGVKKHADKHLYMPGEIDEKGYVHTRMQVRLSMNLFDDVIKKAKKAEIKGYDFDNFEDQKRFILNNQELFALSYRVPTQGQNSTISIEIVDIVPSVQGSMIQFPAGITALTGSDRYTEFEPV